MIDFNQPIESGKDALKRDLFLKLVDQLKDFESKVELPLRYEQMVKSHRGRMKNKIPKDRAGVKR